MATSPPRTPPKKGETIEQQITAAISQGFSTVLNDFKAQNAEMLKALRDLSHKGSMVANSSPSAKNASVASEVSREASDRAEHLSKRLDSPHGVPVRPNHARGRNASAEDHGSGKVTREDLRDRLVNSFVGGAERWAAGALGDPGDGPAYTGVSRRLRHGVHMGANGRYYEYGRSGSIKAEDAYETVKLRTGYQVDEATGVIRDEKGRIRRAEVADDDDERRLLRRALLANRAADVAKAWQSGQPFGRALANAAPKTALRAAGTAASVVQAADKMWNKVQQQYATNRQYQEYLGGTNTDQFGERADRWFNENVRGKFSLLGGGNYDELWMQAMGMGMRGSHRDEYIKYGSQIMKQGANAEQTRELMSLTLEAGGTASSLRDLVSALAGVNRVARDAQVSAKEARSVFIENYKAATSMMLGPSGSAIAQAEAYTTSQVNLGHAYVGRVDYTGMNKRAFTYANANAAGLAPSQWYQLNEQFSSLPNMIANENRIRESLNYMQSQTGDTRTFEQVVNDFIKKLGRPLDPSDTYDLGAALEQAGFNRDVVAQTLSHVYGIQVGPEAALAVAGNLFTSNAPSQVAAQQQDSVTKKLSGPADLGNIRVGSFIPANNLAYSTAFDVQPGWNEALKDIYTKEGGGNRVVSRVPGTVELELLRNVGKYGLDPNTQVMVKAGGGDRIVSLQEALKYFPDQVSNGSVKIWEGDQEGRTIADIMQFNGTSIASAPTTSGNTRGDIGQSVEDHRKDNPAGEGSDASKTSVMIDLTPRAAEILTTYVNSEFYTPGR
jgi:hypothetical protein